MSIHHLTPAPVRYRRASGIAVRSVGDDVVVWDRVTDRMFRVNETALEILTAVGRKPRTMTDLVDTVSKSHRDRMGVIRQDVEKFLINLVEKGIVVEVY